MIERESETTRETEKDIERELDAQKVTQAMSKRKKSVTDSSPTRSLALCSSAALAAATVD